MVDTLKSGKTRHCHV